MTEEEMVVWHHRLNEYRFEQISEDGEGQGSLACCNPQGPKESDMTEQQNNIKIYGGSMQGQVRCRFSTASKSTYTTKNPKMIMFSQFVGRKI